MSQELLAQPEFTKSYVSAIERGRARPSLRALGLLAGRLGVPISELLVDAVSPAGSLDLAAADEDLAYQIDCARHALDTGAADAAVRALDDAAHAYADVFSQISATTRYRFHYGRAAAYIGLGQPADAHRDLEVAAGLAAALPVGAAAGVRVRNARGACYYLEDRPLRAVADHEACLHEVLAGNVPDVNLCLLIYSNLANDYLVLNKVDLAVSTYKEALGLLAEVSNLDRQAGIYWGLSLACKAQGDLPWAILYAQRALSLYEARQNHRAIAQMQVNMAELLIARQAYAEAAARLGQAEAILAPAEDGLLLSRLYEHRALLALRRGDLDEAARAAQRSLTFVAAADPVTPADPRAHANGLRTWARALRMAALVSEEQGDAATADRYFAEALDRAGQIGRGETAYDIQLAYADALAARGDHARAGQYYRAAAGQRFHSAPG